MGIATTMAALGATGKAPRGTEAGRGEEVRSTTEVITNDDLAAVAPVAPSWNAAFLDTDTEGGLQPSQVASHVVPSKRGVAPMEYGSDAGLESAVQVNERIPTAGQAPSIEAAGNWGPGSMKIVEGIEPIYREGTRYGGDYFASSDETEVVGYDYMEASPNPALPGVAATGVANATAAARSTETKTIYQAYYDALMGGLS